MNPYQPPDADESQLDRIERRFTLHHGDCLDVLKTLADCSIDAIVTDPPAGIAFMNREWDRDKGGKADWIQWMQSVADQCLRVIKPGGHALVWAIPRTSHWTGTAWEDAGWQPRDKIYHVFGSGFPKSLDVSKAIDKTAGAERELGPKRVSADGTVAHDRAGARHEGYERPWRSDPDAVDRNTRVSYPATEAAKQWEGWGTALKPAAEEWWLFRKPLIGTVAANVLEHGTGGLNIDGCRVEANGETPCGSGNRLGTGNTYQMKDYVSTNGGNVTPPEGRWPSNFIHDGSEEVLALLGEAARFFMVFQDKEVSLLPENQYNEQLAKGGQSWQTKNDPLFLAGTVAKSLSLPKALEFIAQSVVATSDHQEVIASSDLKEHSIYVTREELKTLCECVTTAMMILGNGFSLESKLEKHTLTKSLVKVAAAKEPTGTTTITTSLLKSDGSAENATLRITQKITVLGGQAYRIAYIPKASRDDRDEGCGALEVKAVHRYGQGLGEGHDPNAPAMNRNPHPTVKPTDLMRYLCRLITPPGGIVLDPFTGSGSTGKAAMAEGFRFIGIEREAEYIEIARARISAEAQKPRQLSLF